MTIDLSDPLFDWFNDVWAAQRGNVDPLAKALRSDRPIDARAEQCLRNALADLITGKFKKRTRAATRNSLPFSIQKSSIAAGG